MKLSANVVGGIMAGFILFSVSVCFAQLNDLEQKALHEEAAKLAKEIGVSESQMYQNLALLHLAKQAKIAAQNTNNPIETEHKELLANLYEGMANTSLKTAFLMEKGKQLLADLQKEQEEAARGKVVSPELSLRLNAFGNAVVDALLTTAEMTRMSVELASFETTQGCDTQKISQETGYAFRCSEAVRKAVSDIKTTMTILGDAVKSFPGAAIFGVTRHFTY